MADSDVTGTGNNGSIIGTQHMLIAM